MRKLKRPPVIFDFASNVSMARYICDLWDYIDNLDSRNAMLQKEVDTLNQSKIDPIVKDTKNLFTTKNGKNG